MTIRSIFVCVFLCLAVVCVLAEAQDTPCCYEPVGEIRMSSPGDWADARGMFCAVAEKDGFVYVLSQADILHVFDCREVGESQDVIQIDASVLEIPLRLGNRAGLLRDGDRLYCYGWSGGQIFDIRDAASPVEVGSFGGEGERISYLIQHENLLVAACHERVVVYSLDLMPNHPIASVSLRMEPRVNAYAVAVVGDRLCVSGSRERSSGEFSFWLGVWDFHDPTRPVLMQIAKTENCGYSLIADDGFLFRLSGDLVELWDVTGTEPRLLDDLEVCGRTVAQGHEGIVLDGSALAGGGGGIDVQCSFSCSEDTCYDTFARHGASTDELILLPRPRSILILQRCSS